MLIGSAARKAELGHEDSKRTSVLDRVDVDYASSLYIPFDLNTTNPRMRKTG
jgi:hypothetical protein